MKHFQLPIFKIYTTATNNKRAIKEFVLYPGCPGIELAVLHGLRRHNTENGWKDLLKINIIKGLKKV